MNNVENLKNSRWLANTLNISLTTLKKLRNQDPMSLPPHIKIGSRFKYKESAVFEWLSSKLNRNLNEKKL